METLSLYEEGLREAERHKWIESQKRGADVGEHGLHDWYDRFWHRYCKSKRWEHLAGHRPWLEFDAGEFGLIPQLLAANDLLLDRIIDRLGYGYENLDLICWARTWGLPMDRVLEILEQIDINRARMHPPGPPRFARR